MDKFKIASLNNYGFEIEYAKELSKHKLRAYEKRHIRRLSRTKLKQNLVKIKNDIGVDI